MHKLPVLGLLVLALTSFLALPQKPHVVSEKSWFLSKGFDEKRYLGIEVLLRGKPIYQSSFRICPIGAGSKKVRSEQTVIFHFKGGHTFQDKYHTVGTETVEGNIWRAGTDGGAILFGLSFSSKNQILLSTIHIAKLDGESTSEIDRGLKVRTFPLAALTALAQQANTSRVCY